MQTPQLRNLRVNRPNIPRQNPALRVTRTPIQRNLAARPPGATISRVRPTLPSTVVRQTPNPSTPRTVRLDGPNTPQRAIAPLPASPPGIKRKVGVPMDTPKLGAVGGPMVSVPADPPRQEPGKQYIVSVPSDGKGRGQANRNENAGLGQSGNNGASNGGKPNNGGGPGKPANDNAPDNAGPGKKIRVTIDDGTPNSGTPKDAPAETQLASTRGAAASAESDTGEGDEPRSPDEEAASSDNTQAASLATDDQVIGTMARFGNIRSDDVRLQSYRFPGESR